MRLSTTLPISRKNSSWPAGEQTQRSRAGVAATFLKRCGAFAGMFSVVPDLASTVSPRNVNSISPSRTVNISSKS